MNDNMQKPDRFGRTIDEIELLLNEYMNEEDARRAVIRMIPVIGSLLTHGVQDWCERLLGNRNG